MICHFILYVRDQAASTNFYKQVLEADPILDVPGMTEFKLADNCILGLMPEKGIKKLLGDAIQTPEHTNGKPRAELYLRIPDPERAQRKSLSAGAKLLSPFERRNWGDIVSYVEDLDGYVLAFTSVNQN